VGSIPAGVIMNQDRKRKIKKVLIYLNNKISVVNAFETSEVKKILEDDDITLKEVVEWYIDYVLSHS
tara:strand:+ start:999 stop:1199 length:201 start_codon:yes stop_codon:yes gene_type:complete